jgi:hypothetical protein
MGFKLSQSHVDEYHAHGFTIFRQIVPTSLLRDLRRVTVNFRDKANDFRYLKPISKAIAEIGPYRDYENLAPLRDALHALLTPEHWHAEIEGSTGLFFNPLTEPYAREWHRDWTGEFPGMPLEQWQAICDDVRYFNQSNCPLYDDDATWFVPGSHLWLNTPAALAKVPWPAPPESLDPVARERMYLKYCRAMPGAVQCRLNAGDFLLYRDTAWHLGVYLPYRTRATIFAYVDHPTWARWRRETDKQWHVGRESKTKAM